MKKILKFQQSLDYYLKILDTRLNEKDYLGALDTARNAFKLAKTKINKQSINLIIGQIYFEMDLYNLSNEYFFRAVQVPQTQAGAYFGIGRNLIFLQKNTLALKYFENSLATQTSLDFSGAILEWTNKIRSSMLSYPQNLNELSLAKKLVKLNKFDDAIETLKDKFKSGDIKAKIFTADILVIKEDYDTARSIIKEILQNNPHDTDALLVLANICLQLNDYYNLESILEDLETLPLKDKQIFILATMYSHIQNYQKSIKYYEKILKNDEFNIKILLFLSICYYNINDTQQALYYIGKARWIDIENQILYNYYDIFNRKLLPPPLTLNTQIPATLIDEKLKSINLSLNSNEFCTHLNTSLILADDIFWSFTLKNNTQDIKIINTLAKCKKKKATNLYNKLLLSTRLTSNQKFYLTKFALLNQNLKTIDINSNLHYVSFKNYIPKSIQNNQTLKIAYCNAVAFAEINNITANFDNLLNIINNIPLNSTVEYQLNENILTCILFSQNMQNLEKACIYFDVDKKSALMAIKHLKLNQ